VLVRMIGDVAYEEVQHLRGLGLVRTEPKGSTLELSTTRRFAEYFGIPSGRPEEIRRLLEQKLGVPSAATAAAPPAAEPAPETGDGPAGSDRLEVPDAAPPPAEADAAVASPPPAT